MVWFGSGPAARAVNVPCLSLNRCGGSRSVSKSHFVHKIPSQSLACVEMSPSYRPPICPLVRWEAVECDCHVIQHVISIANEAQTPTQEVLHIASKQSALLPNSQMSTAAETCDDGPPEPSPRPRLSVHLIHMANSRTAFPRQDISRPAWLASASSRDGTKARHALFGSSAAKMQRSTRRRENSNGPTRRSGDEMSRSRSPSDLRLTSRPLRSELTARMHSFGI